MAVGQLIGPPEAANAVGAHALKRWGPFDDLVEVPAANGPQVTGTPVGLALLAWTGLGKLLGRPAPK